MQKYNVCMRDCYDTCALVTEFDGTRIRVKPNEKNKITSNFLCPKGELLPKWVHSPERLKFPLRRIGERPSRDFEKISWNSAISTIARKMKEVQDNYGSQAILSYYYYGDRGIINAHFPHRLFNYLNASIVEDVICDRAGAEALKDVYGTSQGMDPEELQGEKLIIYWGINAAWTNMHGFYYAKKLDLDIWAVDVVKTKTAKMADIFYMLRPETDVLFALGVAKIMVEEELYNRKFINSNVEGFEPFARYLRSFKMEYIARKTGVEEIKIREFAENYAEKRGVIHIGYGFQKTRNGGEAVRAISILPAMVGKERGFIYSNRILPRSYVRGDALRKKRGLRITQLELADAIEEEKVKFIFIYGTNPLATLPNQKKLRDAILGSDVFIALHDIFLTDTALFSDVVLPSNTFFERFDIADSYYHRYVTINEKVMSMWGKSNVEVAKLLARELGLEEPTLYEDEESIARKILSDAGISYEELREKKVIKIPLESTEPKTESRKIEFYSTRAVKRGLNPFPEYRDAKGKGLKLITPSHIMLISSQYHNTYGYEDRFVYINPEDAEERGIKDGAMVRVFNGYGEIKTTARVSDDIQRGVALIYKAFWPSIIGWNANFLTPNSKNEKYGNSTALHTAWVEVERV